MRKGVIPASVADTIVNLAFGDLDIDRIAQISHEKQHSLLGLIQEMQRIAGPKAGEYVHFGATTQDIVDTGLVLQVADHYQRYEALLTTLRKQLATLTKTYAQTPYMARSHNVHAVPITFGFVLARYLDEIQRHVDRLTQMKADTLTGVFAGAVGSHSALGMAGIAVEEALMAELHLQTETVAWHNAPDRLVAYTGELAMLGATLAKIGRQFYNEASTENQQLAEPIFAAQTQLMHALLSVNERDAIAWKQLWLALPEIHQYVDRQLTSLIAMLDGLVVNVDKMQENVARLGDLVYAEDIMMFLADRLGKQTAHEILFEVAQRSIDQQTEFLTDLMANAAVAKVTSLSELKTVASFEKTTVAIPTLIAHVLEKEVG